MTTIRLKNLRERFSSEANRKRKIKQLQKLKMSSSGAKRKMVNAALKNFKAANPKYSNSAMSGDFSPLSPYRLKQKRLADNPTRANPQAYKLARIAQFAKDFDQIIQSGVEPIDSFFPQMHIPEPDFLSSFNRGHSRSQMFAVSKHSHDKMLKNSVHGKLAARTPLLPPIDKNAGGLCGEIMGPPETFTMSPWYKPDASLVDSTVSEDGVMLCAEALAKLQFKTFNRDDDAADDERFALEP